MIQSIADLELSGKRTFLRVDFNVPLGEAEKILDDSRIVAALPTIRHSLNQGAKLVLASHLGRPKGKVDPTLSLLPVAEHLSNLLGLEVIFPEDCVGDLVRKLVAELKEGQVILLENLRFHPGEEANDPAFSERLAHGMEVYLNDAFGTLHRAHSSTVGMVPLVSQRAAGLLVQKEIEILGQLMASPQKPFWAILGGAKVSDKLGVLEHLLQKVDGIMVGGAMAYTFLQAQGKAVGDSLVESSKLRQAAQILERARLRDIPFLLPKDHVVVQELKPGAIFQTTSTSEIDLGWKGVDIGPQTLEQYGEVIQGAKTVLWNGPVGAFEIPPFDQGTVGLAKQLAKSSARSVVGGGDSISAVKKAQVADQIDHLSTGGGATLEFLEGKTLPGLKALEIEP